MTLGQRLKSRRKDLRMTQKDVAIKAGVAIQTIFKYENEIVTNIPLDRIELLAKALDCAPAYLMGWTNDVTYKKNELLADIVLRLREDDDLLEINEKLCKLTPEQLAAVKTFLAAFN